MTQEEIKNLRVGDTIRISTFHFRSGRLNTTRIIRNIRNEFFTDDVLVVEVKCFGWDRFVLRDHEILELLNR